MTFNTIIKKDFGEFNYDSVELLLPEHIYKYTFKTINKYVLDYTYYGIDSSSIINEYGIDDGNGNKLGSKIEFRTAFEISYEMKNKNRIGLSFSHISNANISNTNPGVEIISLSYQIPY